MFAPRIQKPQSKTVARAAAPSRAPVRPARPLNGWDPKARSPQLIGSLMRGAVQRKCASGAGASRGTCASCEDKESGRLQRKLAIGSSNDPLEHEADRIAEQVLGNGTVSEFGTTPLNVQRHTPTDSQRSEGAPPSVGRTLATPGRPLDAPIRRDMETRFGHDFSQVRVHQGGAAEQSARDVGAQAYTVGSRIVFGAGEYAPETPGGRRVLAHELAHVLQQGAARGPGAAAGGEAQTLRRSLALDSTMQICRRVLTSRNIRVDKGGLKVVLEAQPVDTSVVDCREHPFWVTLTRVKDWGFDPEHATCEASTGANSLIEFGGVARGEYYLTIFRMFDHPYCCLEGVIRAYDVPVSQNSAGCQAGKSLSVMDVVHGALDIAGFIPVLGAIPDGVNAIIYAAEGDWVNAGISVVAAVPVIGDGAKLGVMGGKAVIKVSEEAALTLGKKGIGEALKEAKVVGKEAVQATKTAEKEVGSAAKQVEKETVEDLTEKELKQGAAKGEAKPKSPNQINEAVKRGQAPEGIGRVDVGKVKGEQVHIVVNGGALNIDGTWKHLPRNGLTSAQRKWLAKSGWKLPE